MRFDPTIKPPMWGPPELVARGVTEWFERNGMYAEQLFPFWEQGGRSVQNFGGSDTVKLGSTIAPWTAGAVKINNSIANVVNSGAPGAAYVGTKDFALTVSVRCNAYNSYQVAVANGSYDDGFIFYNYSAADWYFRSNSGLNIRFAASAISPSKFTTFTIFRSEGTSGALIDGVPVSSYVQNGYSASSISSTRPYSFGARHNGSAFEYALNGEIAFSSLVFGATNENQRILLGTTPYAPLQPYAPPVYFDFASGGGTTRQLLASIAGASGTPVVSATTARAIASAIGGVSSTSDVSATTTRAVSAAPQGISVTPDIDAGILRAIAASIAGVTMTPDVTISTARALAASVVGASTTPSITAVISGIIMLSARISGVSITGDITAVCERRIAANIAGQSATPSVSASLLRSLTASIAGTSVTPNITGSLTNLIVLSASIQGISITPTAAATISRAITSSINGTSATQAVLATTVRALMADIQAESITPNNLVLILALLGALLRPGISRFSPGRAISEHPAQRATSIKPVQRAIQQLAPN